jgi:hypothetical protein
MRIAYQTNKRGGAASITEKNRVGVNYVVPVDSVVSDCKEV